jgi:ABC-2 type transport system ATP-binding protein
MISNCDLRSDASPAVELRNVTRRFGATCALDDFSLVVPTGLVFSLIGENGAGKTTMIRHLLGLLKAQQGTVRVCGMDPVADPVGVLSKIGYLSEDSNLPDWMRVRELMRFTQAFYPDWDELYANKLQHDFKLDPDAKIKHLSKGQRARAGLLVALAYRPAILLLDEPSSGLDPIVRRDILGAIIRTVAEEGRTVIFSSHLLSEVERVSDIIAMIKNGRVEFCGPRDAITSWHFRAVFRFDTEADNLRHIDGILSWEGTGRERVAVCAGQREAIAAEAAKRGARLVDCSSLTLDEIFVARARNEAATPAGGRP